MYTGWLRKFKVDRVIEPLERMEALPRTRSEESNERHCVISSNSTYLDIIDRRYRQRGMIATTLSTLVCTGMALFGLWLLVTWVPSARPDGRIDLWLVAIILVLFVGQLPVMYHYTFGKDFFSYKYYPIRFNRRTRMVHAYTDGGPDGVISVPWEEAYFHLGHGEGEKYLRDIRCHVMDGEMVKKTFAVGHYFDDPAVIKQIWEYIRRYMDEGPAAVVNPPEKPQINLSVADTWKNCYLTVLISLGEGLLPYRVVLMPLVLPLAACRWLVFKTSKAPSWPKHIIEESRIDVDDPHRLPEPEYVGQFYGERGV